VSRPNENRGRKREPKTGEKKKPTYFSRVRQEEKNQVSSGTKGNGGRSDTMRDNKAA